MNLYIAQRPPFDIMQAIMTKFIFIIIAAGITLFAASTAFEIKNNGGAQDNKSFLDRALDNAKTEGSFNKLFVESKNQNESTVLKGEERDQINFLFLGIGGEEHISGNYLTDTIILIIFVPSTQTATAISIPRDFLVRAPDKTYFMRINALYAIPKNDPFPGPMGVEYTKAAIENITGVKPDYYAVLDLLGVEKIVDILGGINVRRTQDLEDKQFPDDNYGHETYEIEEGWRYLDGKEATKYIRTRHTPGGDFDRMKRQQEVALAIKKKTAGLKSLSGLPKLLSLYQALQDHFTTDLAFSEIMRLMELGEKVKSEEITFERITAEKDGLLVPDTVIWNGVEAYVLKPKAGTENYEEIKEKIKTIISSLKNG
ncbi:MAG: LCP family protein [Candidatus Spechtbacterales bacterium]